MKWYDVTYTNEAVWAAEGDQNGYSSSSAFTIVFNVLAEGLKDAVAESEKALTAVTRHNNGKNLPCVYEWKLQTAQEEYNPCG
jgi:hypothetical protein